MIRLSYVSVNMLQLSQLHLDKSAFRIFLHFSLFLQFKQMPSGYFEIFLCVFASVATLVMHHKNFALYIFSLKSSCFSSSYISRNIFSNCKKLSGRRSHPTVTTNKTIKMYVGRLFEGNEK